LTVSSDMLDKLQAACLTSYKQLKLIVKYKKKLE